MWLIPYDHQKHNFHVCHSSSSKRGSSLSQNETELVRLIQLHCRVIDQIAIRSLLPLLLSVNETFTNTAFETLGGSVYLADSWIQSYIARSFCNNNEALPVSLILLFMFFELVICTVCHKYTNMINMYIIVTLIFNMNKKYLRPVHFLNCPSIARFVYPVQWLQCKNICITSVCVQTTSQTVKYENKYFM